MIPKVSILIPVYGVEKFIKRCAVSLFEQTFQNIEFIFINDCTPDESITILLDVIKRYPNRKDQITIINHEINKGLAGARNTGVSNATGDYILHVDSDDYLELSAVELLYEKAIGENADIVVSDFILEWNNTKQYVTQVFDKDKIQFIRLILSANATPSVWNKLFRRSLYVENKIKAIENTNLGEDLLVTTKLLYYAKKVVKLNLPTCHYIQFNSSSYTKLTSLKNIQDVVVVFDDLTTFFNEKKVYSQFSDYILQGKVKKKIEFLQNSNLETFEISKSLFPETEVIKDLNFLNRHEKLILNLIKLNSNFLLRVYLKLYRFLFSIVQKIKGR